MRLGKGWGGIRRHFQNSSHALYLLVAQYQFPTSIVLITCSKTYYGHYSNKYKFLAKRLTNLSELYDRCQKMTFWCTSYIVTPLILVASSSWHRETTARMRAWWLSAQRSLSLSKWEWSEMIGYRDEGGGGNKLNNKFHKNVKMWTGSKDSSWDSTSLLLNT